MKKILIFGGAGYIGTRLSNQLHKSGYDIKVIDNFWFGDYLDSDIKKEKKNLWDIRQNDIKGYDAILFLAGLSNDPMAMFRPDLNFIENSSAPVYLAFLAKSVGIRRFICASSCSVYGFTKNKTLNEGSPVKPSYAYGISKLQCETGLQTLEDESFKPIVFRKGTVGGWSPKMRYDLVVNTMLKTAFTTGKIIVNNPNIWRPLVDIRDVIQGYEKAIEVDDDVSGVFNLSGQNMTIGNLGELITEELKKRNYSVELIINENNDVRNYKVSTEKIEDELNFKSRFTVLDSLSEILDNIDPTCYDFNREEFSNITTFQKVIQR